MARKSTPESKVTNNKPPTIARVKNGNDATTPRLNTRPQRQSSASKPKASPSRSKYFESDEEDREASEVPEGSSEGTHSGYDDDDEESASSAQGTFSEESDVLDSEDEPVKKKRRTMPKHAGALGHTTKVGNGSTELWRPGVKSGLGPGVQLVIKKPKAREAGRTPYQDNTVHPNTMLFLQDLAKNNDREWLKMHDADYRPSLKDWSSYVEAVTSRVIEADETVPELPSKDIIFRIYRDVRFSKDPTPYKTAYSAAWSRTGRKGPYACYYMQIKPGGNSLIAGGLWMPEAQYLAKLRRDVDRNPDRLKRILKEPRLRKAFLSNVGSTDNKVVDAFCKQNASSALKTKPKGFDADHKEIALLRLRSYTVSRKLSDAEVVAADSLERIIELISYLVPLVTYLNDVVMPDHEDEDDEISSDEAGEGSGQEVASSDEESDG